MIFQCCPYALLLIKSPRYRLALSRAGNRTQNGTTERKGNSRLQAPLRLLACIRLPLRPALSQKMQGNAAQPIRGRLPSERIPMAKLDISSELPRVPGQTPWHLETPRVRRWPPSANRTRIVFGGLTGSGFDSM